MTRTSLVPLIAAIAALFVAPSDEARAQTLRATEQLTGPWQLFIDDEGIASKMNVSRRYHPFRKHTGNPLIKVDRPWELHVVNATTVIPGEDGTGLRMYYYCWTDRSKGGPGSFMCYATSKDGVTWEKPDLGLYEYEGSRNNNILPKAPTHVMRTPWEQDPQKKYHGVGDMYHAYTSPDGIQWTRTSQETIVSGGDTSHFYWDPHTQRFRCTVKGASGRVSGDISGMRRRVVGFAETNDLNKFPPLRMVMAPDDDDDLWCMPDSVQRTHFYACPVTPYESMYVGFLQIYRAEEPEGYFHGPLWLELVSSRDGIRWNRQEVDTRVRSVTALHSLSRSPLLSVGKFREFDRGMIIAPSPVLVGDELWIYYTGYDEEHDLLPYRSAIGLAKLRKDGFASLDADEAVGEVVTKAFEKAGGVMQVNYDARGGSLRVELLDANGQVIPGYDRGACKPLTGNEVRQSVSWTGKKELPSTGPIRFRFILDRARLFSFMPGEGAKLLPEPAGPFLQALYTFDGTAEAWADVLGEDGLQTLRNLGTCTLDHKQPDPAFGRRSLIVGSQWRPWNRVEIEGTRQLGRHFTLAAMVKPTQKQLSRLFSAYDGMSPIGTADLVFDFDPSGRVLDGLRFHCKGIRVDSAPVSFTQGKYHHLAVVYDDGIVRFYFDGKLVSEEWIPGGDPVMLSRDLLVGEDAKRGSDEQLHGHVDDLLVYGRALGGEDIAVLAEKGAAVLFKLNQ